MNKNQSTVLWIGIAVFVLIALTTQTMFKKIGSGQTGRTSIWIVDYGPLVGRLMSTVIVTGGLIYTLKDKKDESQRMRKNNK